MKLNQTPRFSICSIIRSSHDALLNTDEEKRFNTLSEKIQVKYEDISYEEKDHRLLWLNINNR